MEKPKILFLCTGNSCRSQMAEGWARSLLGETFQAYSAGIEKHGINPRARQVMAEAGVDISGQESQTVEELPGEEFDYVVSLCDNAKERCPFFPARTRVLHRSFDDPPGLTASFQEEEAILAVYRRVRDEIRAFVEDFPSLTG